MADTGSDPFCGLIASSVHDAKGILAVAEERLHGLLEHCGGDVEAQRLGSGVGSELQRLNHLLVRLLTTYKMEGRHYALNIDVQDPRSLLTDLVAQSRSLAKARGLTLDVDCAPGLDACFDANLVSGVLANALHNGIRYARSTVRLAAREEGQGGIVFSIEDDGPGFPSGTGTGWGTPTTETGFASGNTGLGLHFGRRVAAAHRAAGREGSLQIDNLSSLGGARVVLTLP